VVAGAHHRDRDHQRRHHDREPRPPSPQHPGDGETGDQRPADVIARERGDLIGPLQRVRQVVAACRVADGADEAGHEARGRHRHEREQHDPDRPRHDHRVAEPGQHGRCPEGEEHHRDDQERPMEPHVSAAQELADGLVLEHPSLDVTLDVDAEPRLQVEQIVGIASRRRPVTLDDQTEHEVADHREHDDAELSPGSGRLRGPRRHGRNEPHRHLRFPTVRARSRVHQGRSTSLDALEAGHDGAEGSRHPEHRLGRADTAGPQCAGRES
jgi:hypothetical protein